MAAVARRSLDWSSARTLQPCSFGSTARGRRAGVARARSQGGRRYGAARRPEETLDSFRRQVREAVDPDDRLSLSGLVQGLPADLARSFENLSGECWRHMGEAFARRQELTRGHGLS